MRPANLRKYAYFGALVALFALTVAVPILKSGAAWCYTYYDLGIYSDAAARLSWNNLNPWLSARQVHIFNDHFDPVVLLVAPLTRWLDARLVMQLTDLLAPCLGLTALLWLQRRGQLNPSAAGLLGALVLFNTGVLEAMHFPSHPTTWAMAPMMWLGALLLAGRLRLAASALLLLFCCKEEFPFVGVMLAAILARRRDTRGAAVGVGVLTLAWCVVAFAVRPMWAPTSPYAGMLVRGLLDHPMDYLWQRLSVPGMASRWASLLVPAAPLGVWLWQTQRRRPVAPGWCQRPDLGLLLLLVPLLAIRFLGMAWRHHYMAVVVAGAVMALVPWLQRQAPPRWVWGLTVVLLLTTNTNRLKFAVESWSAPATHFTAYCPNTPERLASIAAAVDYLKTQPGKVLLQQNLVLATVPRDDIYALGGEQPSSVEPYDWLLVEAPPFGHGWPMSHGVLQTWLAAWRAQSDTQVVINDGHLWLLRGQFRMPPAAPPSVDHPGPAAHWLPPLLPQHSPETPRLCSVAPR